MLFSFQNEVTTFLYCTICCKAWREVENKHPDHDNESLSFPGIFLQRDFVTEAEEIDIVDTIYRTPFVDSQSGRRKQVVNSA